MIVADREPWLAVQRDQCANVAGSRMGNKGELTHNLYQEEMRSVYLTSGSMGKLLHRRAEFVKKPIQADVLLARVQHLLIQHLNNRDVSFRLLFCLARSKP